MTLSFRCTNSRRRRLGDGSLTLPLRRIAWLPTQNWPLCSLTCTHLPNPCCLNKSVMMLSLIELLEVIEHVDNPVSFLETCAELVMVCVVFSLSSHILKHIAQPSGHLFLSTINRTPLSYFLTIRLANMFFLWSPVTPGTNTYSSILNQLNSSTFSSNTDHLSILKVHPGRGLVVIFHTPREHEIQMWLQNAIICSALGSQNPHTRGHPCFISLNRRLSSGLGLLTYGWMMLSRYGTGIVSFSSGSGITG